MEIKDFSKLNIEPLIAPQPKEPRDESRLMVVNRKTSNIEHRIFKEIIEYLSPGDCIVINESKVWKAKLKAKKTTGGAVELLLVSKEDENGCIWKALCRKIKINQELLLPEDIKARCVDRKEDGSYIFELSQNINLDYLNRNAFVPLPSYIEKKRKKENMDLNMEQDLNRYQTVYANEIGSIAAPTAGFHFTRDLLNKIEEKGIKIAKVTLHVGWGTFKPVRTNPENHIMLPEFCSISERSAEIINESKRNNKKIISVGTSSTRTLEKMSDESCFVKSGSLWADIFIYPGYRFKAPDMFITNFHLPDSPPIYMTAAFCGIDLLYKAYNIAVENKYRFYSYGDAMLII
jgi:S-adenosylmethionine:tRNA ribosyltransferase-isomerase